MIIVEFMSYNKGEFPITDTFGGGFMMPPFAIAKINHFKTNIHIYDSWGTNSPPIVTFKQNTTGLQSTFQGEIGSTQYMYVICYIIGIDTNIEVIVGSSTTGKRTTTRGRSPRAVVGFRGR